MSYSEDNRRHDYKPQVSRNPAIQGGKKEGNIGVYVRIVTATEAQSPDLFRRKEAKTSAVEETQKK